MNLAYRWFIGYPLNEAVPHFHGELQLKHRFNHGTVEYVFGGCWCRRRGRLSGHGSDLRGWDPYQSKRQSEKAGPKGSSKQGKAVCKELFDEVNRDREGHGKSLSRMTAIKSRQRRRETVTSTTDPESGVFHKGEHKKCFATKRIPPVTSIVSYLVFTSPRQCPRQRSL